MPKLVSRPFLLAFVLSILTHILMIAGANFSLPDWTEADEPIEVSLLPPPVPPKVAPVATKPIPVAPSNLKEKPKPAPKAEPQPASPVEPAVSQPVPQGVPEPVESSGPEQAPVAPQSVVETPSVPVEEPPEAVPAPPKRVEMGYLIQRGSNGGSVGKVKRTFKLEGEDRYVLDSVAEATGLVSLFYSGKYEEHSDGAITSRGLQPHNYRLKRGSGKAQTATFDWALRSVALDSGSNHAVVQVTDGAQDMLSFLYQFMFVPPLEEMLITIANGKKLKTYAYGFEGEETIETRLGKMRVWHIAKLNADSDDKMEFWLAADYRYLPVRIRQTERDGTVTELSVTTLQIE